MKNIINKEELILFLQGLKILGKGSTRIVFEINDNEVLKVAFNTMGNMQNKSEFNVYKKLKNTNLSVYFAEVFDFIPETSVLPSMLFEQKVQQDLSLKSTDIFKTFSNDMKEVLNDVLKNNESTIDKVYGVPFFKEAFASRNVGFYNDEIVSCDYGSTPLVTDFALLNKVDFDELQLSFFKNLYPDIL